MNFEPDEDLGLFLAAIDRLASPCKSARLQGEQRFEHARSLEEALQQGGFFGAASEPSLGPIAATAMVHALAQLPVCAEIAASALIIPLVCPERPGPMAVLWGDAGRPARYLTTARTVLHVGPKRAALASLEARDVRTQDSVFAYPMGCLKQPSELTWEALPDERLAPIQNLWRLGLSSEMVGCLQAGLDAVVEHVKTRQQFGRPLGTFQAIQHRLASAASAVQAARWLCLRAASTGASVDAATALAYAQDIASRIVYDLHQFMGAMGLTLEHPLHRWTYRLKLLRSELGGAERQYQELAELAWASA